jgi:hypothetical protein
LEELKLQIDELGRSKENLERSAFTLLEEIKGLKGKVDMEAMNLTSISGDLRNKTRKLEDENRAHVNILVYIYIYPITLSYVRFSFGLSVFTQQIILFIFSKIKFFY